MKSKNIAKPSDFIDCDENLNIIEESKEKLNSQFQKNKKCDTIISVQQEKISPPNPDDESFIEYILMDFRNFEDLNKFKNLQSLSLIQQGITTIEVICKSQYSNQIEYLCLNENNLTDLKFVDNLINLKNLQVNFNFIDKIEYINKLDNLNEFWICENKIKKIENIPPDVRVLNLNGNLIEKIPKEMTNLANLSELNVSANNITDLRDIFNITQLTNLKILYFIDENFGDNPICHFSNYRVFILHHLKNLETLDSVKVTNEEKKECESIFAKKSLFYKTKIKNMNKTTKNIFNLLKVYRNFYFILKYLQIQFFSQRIKMLEYFEYEYKILNSEKDDSPRFQSDLEVSKEIDCSLEKIKKCLKGIQNVNESFRLLKDFISDVNDFSIVNNFYEFETVGNFKLEAGVLNDKWTLSVIELIKSKTSFRSNNIKGLNFLKIWKILNRRQKIIFDSINEILSEGQENNLKKIYDYMFLNLDISNKKDETIICEEKKLVEFLLNDFNINSESDSNFYILTNYIEEKIKNKEISTNSMTGPYSLPQLNKYIIVCKCITLESLITKNKDSCNSSNHLLGKSIEDIVSDYVLKNSNNLKSDIIEIPIESKQSIFLCNNKSLILPEFLVSYDYLYSNPLGISLENSTSKLDYSEVVQSSYTNKFEINQEHIENFNMCCRKIHNNENELIKKSQSSPRDENIQIQESLNFPISNEAFSGEEIEEGENIVINININDIDKFKNPVFQYSILNSFDSNFFQKYQTCNFSDLNEIDSSCLFFCKSSIFKFMSKCFHSKYSKVEDFFYEIAEIKEKIKEIQNLSFKYNKLERIISLDNHIIKNMKTINFFNSNLNDEKFNEFLSYFQNKNSFQENGLISYNLEEIRVSKNVLIVLDIEKLSKFENLKILDFSHNLIEKVLIPNSEFFENIILFDISFNLLANIDFLLIYFKNPKLLKLEIVNFIGNPYPKEYFCHFEFEIIKSKFGLGSIEISRLSKLNLSKEANINNDSKILKDPYENAKPISNKCLIKDCIINRSDLKQFDILYETFSLGKYKKYKNFSENNEFFRILINKEKASLILLKKKLINIPNFQSNDMDLINVNLEEVKVLYLNLNKILKIEKLEVFKNLEELYLQNNKISKIENLNELKCLLRLDLSNNLLQDIDGISQTKNLIYLNIENNLLKFLSISELSHILNLTELHASGNLLTNLKDILELKNCPKLQVLDLSNNEVVRQNIQDFRLNIIFCLSKLTILNKIPIEKIEYQQAKEYFDGKITLDLLNSKLISFSNSAFNFDLKILLTNLEELNLTNCKLKDSNGKNDFFFDQSVFCKLKKLDLSRNCFTSFIVFGNLPSLIILNFNCNLFEKLIGGNRGGGKDRNEKFEKNSLNPQIQITQIKSQLYGLSGIINLENLELADNSLSDISGINILKNLRNLNLRQNNLNKIDQLDNLPNLLYLDLSFNKIRNLEKSNVGNLPVLKSLSCDSNYLKNINAFSKFQSLVYATFDNNKICDFSNIDRLSIIESLRELNISNNPIIKSLNYRNNIIKKFFNCNKIDNLEISKEERELALMELQLEAENNEGGFGNFGHNNINQNQYQFAQNNLIDRINFNSNNNINTINYNSANTNNTLNNPTKQGRLQEKFPGPMKVNMINLDLLSGNKIPQNPSLNIYSSSNLISPRNKEPLSLPQIQTRKNPSNYLNPQVIQSKKQIYQRFNTNLNVMSPFGGIHVGNVNNFAGNMFLNQYYTGAQYLNHNSVGPYSQGSNSQILSMKSLSSKTKRSNGGMTPNSNLIKNIGDGISVSGYPPPEGRAKINSKNVVFDINSGANNFVNPNINNLSRPRRPKSQNK